MKETCGPWRVRFDDINIFPSWVCAASQTQICITIVFCRCPFQTDKQEQAGSSKDKAWGTTLTSAPSTGSLARVCWTVDGLTSRNSVPMSEEPENRDASKRRLGPDIILDVLLCTSKERKPVRNHGKAEDHSSKIYLAPSLSHTGIVNCHYFTHPPL